MAKIYHPIAIEVKTTNANPWFAVVENLIQIRLSRFNLNNIEQHAIKHSLANKNLQKARGAWGLVLAPSKYFGQNRPHLEAALKLIQELKRKTEARIILASTDDLVLPQGVVGQFSNETFNCETPADFLVVSQDGQ